MVDDENGSMGLALGPSTSTWPAEHSRPLGGDMKDVRSRAACTILVLALACPAGCGRTSILTVVDGGSAVPGPEVRGDRWREVIAETAPGIGPESGPEIGRDTVPEVGSEVGRDAGPEVGRDVGWDVGVEAGPEAHAEAGPEARREAGPEARVDGGLDSGADASREVGRDANVEAGSTGEVRTGCLSASKEVRGLHALDGESLGLAVHGDRVFVGVGLAVPSGELASGQILSVSMSTGAETTLTIDSGFPTSLVAQQDALSYVSCIMVPISERGWRTDCTNVVRWDLQTGTATKLDNPSEYASPSVTALVGNSRGDLFWAIQDGYTGPAGIVHWEPTSGSATTLLRTKRVVKLVADDESLYWQEFDDFGHVLFRSVAMAGGTVAQPYLSSAAVPDTTILEAVDARSLYYSSSHDIAAGIVAMPKGGGPGVTVVPNVDPFGDLDHAIDETHVYWVGYGNQDTLRRTLKTDSTQSEPLWNASRGVRDVVVDACNVYWIAQNPYELLVRSK